MTSNFARFIVSSLLSSDDDEGLAGLVGAGVSLDAGVCAEAGLIPVSVAPAPRMKVNAARNLLTDLEFMIGQLWVDGDARQKHGLPTEAPCLKFSVCMIVLERPPVSRVELLGIRK